MRYVIAAIFLFGLLGGVGVASGVWAVIDLVNGRYLSAIVLMAVTVFCVGFIAYLIVVRAGRVSAREELDDSGVVIRPDQRVDLLLQVSSSASYLAMGMYAVLAPLGKLHIPVPPGWENYFLWISVAGAILGSVMTWQTIKRGGTSYVRLDACGLELWQGMSLARVAWNDVRDVADRPSRGPKPVRGTIFVVTADGKTRMLAADAFTPGGHKLRELVRFYWKNPGRRVELADDRVLKRLSGT